MPKIYSNNPFYPEETGAFRHELKLLCSAQDLAIVRARLKNLLPFDTHAGENGQYTIRSLYFDDYNDSCLRENEAGVDNRRKYRHPVVQRLPRPPAAGDQTQTPRHDAEAVLPPHPGAVRNADARALPAVSAAAGPPPAGGVLGCVRRRPRAERREARRPWPPPRRNGRLPGNRRPSGSFASR